MIRNTNEHDDLHDGPPPEECYKVVLRKDGYLMSITGDIDLFPSRVIYTPLERTVPKIGKLFVFMTLDKANNFWKLSQVNYNEEIWLAHGENLQPIDLILPWADVRKHANDFWRTYNQDDPTLKAFHHELSIYPAPWGTYVSDSVTLIKRL